MANIKALNQSGSSLHMFLFWGQGHGQIFWAIVA